MNVVIFGGAGFIGSHLVDRYCADGHRVMAIDNLGTGDIKNLADAMPSGSVRFLNADVVNEFETVRSAVLASRPNLILHFASPASPVDYGRMPIETLRVNSIGTEHALKLTLETGARFLFASTSETYGDPLQHPQPETYWGNVNPIGIRSCYDEAKRFGEALTMAYTRTHSLDARIIRIFNTYGPRMRSNDGRVVPNFITQAVAGKPLTIYGSGTQTRSFCYVSDLVEGIVRVAASDATRGKVINLGNPAETQISEFARIVSEIVGVPLRVDCGELPPDDPTRRCPDITLARALLGWEPKVPLREGLARTIQHFRD